MTTEQITEAKQLKDRGNTIRDISQHMGGTAKGASKSAVHEALKNHGESDQDADERESTEKRPAPIHKDVELGKLDLTLSHERKMAELKLRQDELAIQRKQVELDSERAENEKRMLHIREQQFAQEQQGVANRQSAEKEMFADKFNKLVRELLKNCQDATWSGAEVEEFIARIKKLQAKVGKFCDRHILDEDDLAIWHHVAALLKLMETTQEQESGFFSSDVDIDFDKSKIKEIRAWLIKDFDEKYVKPVKKTCSEDENEEEEDDAEDENELSGFAEEKTLVKTFNDLVAELADNSDNTSWDEEEYEDYQNRIETFQEELSEYVDTLRKPFDTERQAIHVLTEQLLEYVTSRGAVVKESGATLTLRPNVIAQAWLAELPVEDFWEEIEETDDED